MGCEIMNNLKEMKSELTRNNFGTTHALSEGYEQYYGTYNLARKIEMRSTFEDYDTSEYDWLPCCCTNNWVNMGMQDQVCNADRVFSSS